MELVNGRECGECTVCCTALTIDTEEFKKVPGVQCAHLCGGGCSIYETRYPVCRQYHCGWRYLEFLGEHWRPDKSGVLINFEADNKTLGYDKGGVNFFIVAPPPKPFIREWAGRIAHLISSNVAVYLSVAGPPGCYSITKFLSEELREAAMKRDMAHIEIALTDAVAMHRFQPQLFTRASDMEEDTRVG